MIPIAVLGSKVSGLFRFTIRRGRGAIWFFAFLLAASATSRAQEPPAPPLLVGNNPLAVTPQILETIHALLRASIPPLDDTTVWMVHRSSDLKGDGRIESTSYGVYLRPEVSTSRLVRGREVLCHYFSGPNPYFPYSPVIDGLTLSDRHPTCYAFVAPADHPFRSGEPFTNVFYLYKEGVSDDDVIAIVDPLKALYPQRRIHSLNDSITLPGQGKSRESMRVACSFVHDETYNKDNSRDHSVSLEKNGTRWEVMKVNY